MYSALWRNLPGSTAYKVFLISLVLLAVITALFTRVFPLIAEYFPLFGSSIGPA